MDSSLSQRTNTNAPNVLKLNIIGKIATKVCITSKINKQREECYISILPSFWGSQLRNLSLPW